MVRKSFEGIRLSMIPEYGPVDSDSLPGAEDVMLLSFDELKLLDPKVSLYNYIVTGRGLQPAEYIVSLIQKYIETNPGAKYDPTHPTGWGININRLDPELRSLFILKRSGLK